MNEQLQNATIVLINKAITATEKGAEFFSEQIPEVVNQLLIWNATRSFLATLFGIVILYFLFIFNIKQYKWWIETPNGERYRKIDENFALLALLNIIQLILIPITITFINLTWLQILISPKIFLIEYAAKLIK